MTSLPDLGQPRVGEAVTVYAPDDGVGPATAVPHRLRLARQGGLPDVRLELVRSASVRDVRYGLLDLRVESAADLDEAAQLLDDGGRPGPVEHVVWERCTARMTLPGLPGLEDVVQERPAAGPGRLRFVVHLVEGDAALADQLLVGGVLAPEVVAELRMTAVAPRLPLTVVVDPPTLLAALGVRSLVWQEWLDLLADQLARHRAEQSDVLPGLRLEGDLGGIVPTMFATAVAVRAQGVLTVLEEAGGSRAGPPVRLLPAASGGPEQQWDLATTCVGQVPVVLSLDAGEVPAALRQHGADAFRTFVDVPPLRTGFRAVSVVANLPSDRTGAVLGVRVQKEGTPNRPPVDQAVLLTPPTDRGEVVVQLAPAEDPELAVSTFAHLPQVRSTRIDGPERRTVEGLLRVGPDAFPVRFLPLAAAPGLLEQGRLLVTANWRGPDDGGSLTTVLDRRSGTRTLVLPAEAEVVDIAVLVTAEDGRTTRLVLSEVPSRLDVHHFPDHGPHAVEVRGRFRGAAAPLAVELQPDGASDDEQITLLVLRSTAPSALYRWTSRSVFPAGFRYRLRLPDGSRGAWSDVQPADGALELQPP